MTGFMRVRREALLIDPALVPYVARALDLLLADRRRDGLVPVEDLQQLADEAAAIAATDEIRRSGSVEVPSVAGGGSDAVRWVDVTGAASHLGCTPENVRKLARRGSIRGVGGGRGGEWRLDADSVAEYAERRRRRR